jgi:hypothetical protein
VIDLSKGGVSFWADRPPESIRVSVLLTYANDEDPIPLEGRIAYFVARGTRLNYRFRVGVEFVTFSPRKGHNSLEMLRRLERVVELYAPEDSPDIPG